MKRTLSLITLYLVRSAFFWMCTLFFRQRGAFIFRVPRNSAEYFVFGYVWFGLVSLDYFFACLLVFFCLREEERFFFI